MRYQLYREQQLNCNQEDAWKFFSSPNNLSKITPADMNFIVHTKLENKPIYHGMEIEYTVSPFPGIPMKWTTVIIHVDPGNSFSDFQKKGPYKYWRHHHEFIPNEKGVLMKDTVDYELPFGFIGQIAHRLMVRNKLETIFNFRFHTLEKMFNTI